MKNTHYFSSTIIFWDYKLLGAISAYLQALNDDKNHRHRKEFNNDGDVIIVQAGAKHNVINTGSSKELKMYTIYDQHNHKDGVVKVTKQDAKNNHEEFDGKTTE